MTTPSQPFSPNRVPWMRWLIWTACATISSLLPGWHTESQIHLSQHNLISRGLSGDRRKSEKTSAQSAAIWQDTTGMQAGKGCQLLLRLIFLVRFWQTMRKGR